MDAEWTEGKGEIPDILFHPQFASNDEDYKFCMCNGWGKSGRESKYDKDREILNKIRKTDMPDGGTSQPAIGQPAIGSRGQSALARWKPLESNILQLNLDGTWKYRNGKCISLSECLPSVASPLPWPSCTSTTTIAGALPPRGHMHGPRHTARWLPGNAKRKRGGGGMATSRWQCGQLAIGSDVGN